MSAPSRRRRGAALLALSAALLGLAPASGAARETSALAARLDAALSVRALRGARVGALVVAEDGHVLYAKDPDRALVPASNQKILTAIAALSTFGPAHRFVTEILADAPPDANGAVGVLAVRAGGDPSLTSEDLWRLAADLRRRGVRRVRGGIVLDASAFDTQWWHPSWGVVSARAYHAPIGALTVNYGAYSVTATAGRTPGAAVQVRVDPPAPYLRVVNRARTVSAGTRQGLVLDRRMADGDEEVIVRGTVRAGSGSVTHYRSVLDPVRYAGSVLRMQLEANGIEVLGETRVAPVPEGAVSIFEFEGRPLADVVRRFMKYSNNAIGEGLVKALGAREGASPASWSDGMEALRSALAAVGISTEGLTLLDGSGLSYGNRVSPHVLVEALRSAEASFRFGPEFQASLPIASADGTLEKRARDAAYRVRAKTGLLTRVTSLSGYAELPDGERAVFSVIVNGFRVGAGEAMDAVDGFVAALVGGPSDGDQR